jgi:hypothetical protein
MTPEVWQRDFAQGPFFHGLKALAGSIAARSEWPDAETLESLASARAVTNSLGLPIRFQPQLQRLGQRDYEGMIHDQGTVPTRRENWHDLHNALIWLAWPRAKAALNAVQIARLSTSTEGRRGPVSDAATLFDESGLVLVARDEQLAQALRARAWRDAFWESRSLWSEARLYLFGHSLLEKSPNPPPGITGKCLFLRAETRDLDDERIPEWLDAAVANAWLSGQITGPKTLFAVPLRGVPGFDPANARADYYDNKSVFRPVRT